MADTVYKTILENQRKELVNRIDAIKRDIKQGLDPNLKEQALQLENYEVLQGLLKQAEVELNEIDKKLFLF